jgi:hypothetical protein
MNAMRENEAFNGIVAGAAETLLACGHGGACRPQRNTGGINLQPQEKRTSVYHSAFYDSRISCPMIGLS